MSIHNCFDSIIGFTRGEDECVDGYEAEYSESLSGLYVDELQGMSLRILNSLGGSTDIWEKMENARRNAIDCFKTDILQEILKYNEPIRSRFYGDIGGRSYTRLVSPGTYYGMRMFSDIRGGEFVLDGVSLILNSTEAVDLLIYDDYELLHTIPIQSTAGRPRRTNFTPITLDLNGNYYFLINPVGVPYQNKLTCGCGGYRWCFNVEQPCFRYSRDKWTEWAMVGGISGGDVNDRFGWSVVGSSKGMSLHGSFRCNSMGIICNDYSDFVNNEVDVSTAWAVLYKTGEFLTNYILDSEEVSRYTLLGTESLNENRAYYNTRYAIMVDFIANNAEIEKNECLKCKSIMGRRTQML